MGIGLAHSLMELQMVAIRRSSVIRVSMKTEQLPFSIIPQRERLPLM